MARLTAEELLQLKEKAYSLRKKCVEMVIAAKWGHLGGSFSMVELLTVLYNKYVDIDPAAPNNPQRDYVVLSKAHGSPALYAALEQKGVLTQEELFTYCKIGGLEGHLDALDTPGVEMTSGSLGLGISYSVGLALGLRRRRDFIHRVYCIVGDGELCEGQMWEGIMSAGHYHLDNLIVIVDYNKVMAKGFVYEQMAMEPLAQRFESFGWNTIEVDGHDMEEIFSALDRAKYRMVVGKPICIIAHTTKGRGVRDCEFNFQWHTHAPTIETGNHFLREIAETYGQPYQPFEPQSGGVVDRTFEDIVKGVETVGKR